MCKLHWIPTNNLRKLLSEMHSGLARLTTHHRATRGVAQVSHSHNCRAISRKATRSALCTRPLSRTTPTTGLSGFVLYFAHSSPTVRSATWRHMHACSVIMHVDPA